MPDISMCQGRNCSIKEKCYRHRADPNPHRQSFASFKYDTSTESCDHFYKIESHHQLAGVDYAKGRDETVIQEITKNKITKTRRVQGSAAGEVKDFIVEAHAKAVKKNRKRS